VSDSCYALLAGSVRHTLLLKPRRMELAGTASGLTMIGLGAHFALTGRKPG
jgi:threonine/homoserine/homoserine lactone efflux protein